MLFNNLIQSLFVSLPLANIGVPLFTTNVFWQISLLIPIILIELFFYEKTLKINLFTALKISFITNIFSTFLGVVIIFVFAVFGGMIDFSRPPLDSSSFNLFVIFRFVGLLMMWITSAQAEYWLGLRLLKGTERKIIKKSFLKANALSYLFLAIVMTTSIVVSLSEARNSITSIQKDLAEFDRVCPVIVKSDACDQVFRKRVESYQKLGQIYCRHGSLKLCMDNKLQRVSEVYASTAKTCLQDDQRVVCQEAR